MCTNSSFASRTSISASCVEPLLTFADVLRKKNLKKLLRNERYRDLLVGDNKLMLAQLDEFEEGLEVPPQAAKRQYSLCSSHATQVFRSLGPVMTTCAVCPVNTYGFGQKPALVRGIVEVPPLKRLN